MFRLRITTQAQRELKKISQLHRQLVLAALEDIEENPFQGKALVKEYTGKIAYKIGVYRIIYKINAKDETVDILTAGHRSIIYIN